MLLIIILSMELTRIVHPVGQGGFYSEQLKEGKNEVLVFFDCGGNNRKSMEKYIRNYFPVKPKKRKSNSEKNGGDCYSKTEQTVTVLMAQN